MIKTAILVYLLFGIIGTYIFVKTPETQEILNPMPFAAVVLCVIYSIVVLPFEIIKGVVVAISKKEE